MATVIEADQTNIQFIGKRLLITESQLAGELLESPLASAIQRHKQSMLNQKGAQVVEIKTNTGLVNILCECYHPVAKLLVLGGGHIAQPLVNIASLLQYEITVVDDRPAFANKQRFAAARLVICDSFQSALRQHKIDKGTSVVIVTRGHKHDLECLEAVLQFEPAYIGMIGSKRRVKMVKEHLIGKGYSPEVVNQVHMPIGIAIGAETPEEIAVSIAAQLVAAKNGVIGGKIALTSSRQQWEMLEQILKAKEQLLPVVLATIVRTKAQHQGRQVQKCWYCPMVHV
ncbi:hypothetical protein N752_20530 [Desulforamulus aquiferis]|nr:XdhC family protein [Desulforamulus aquiferis]RYD03221.1 hypothetical protein N752_20530 [Desulforamulus aquiferis]